MQLISPHHTRLVQRLGIIVIYRLECDGQHGQLCRGRSQLVLLWLLWERSLRYLAHHRRLLGDMPNLQALHWRNFGVELSFNGILHPHKISDGAKQVQYPLPSKPADRHHRASQRHALISSSISNQPATY